MLGQRLGGVGDAVSRLDVFSLLGEIGNLVFAFHNLSIQSSACCCVSFTVIVAVRPTVISTCERGDSNPHGLLHWILSPARLPIPPLPRRFQNTNPCAFRKRENSVARLPIKKSPRDFRGGFRARSENAIGQPEC